MEAQADLYTLIRNRLLHALEADNAETAMDEVSKWWADVKAAEVKGCKAPVPEPVYSPEDIPQEMPPHQQRVLAERAALDEKIKKLTAFLEKKPCVLTLSELDLLVVQHGIMVAYSYVLSQRIAAF